MALVTAKVASNLATLDLHALLAGTTARAFLDNANLHSAQNILYEDAVQWTLPDSLFLLGGQGLAVSPAGAITGGILTGILRGSGNGPWYAIEKIGIDAVTLYAAALSVSTADDMALYGDMFAFNDTFNLSPGNDVADGFAGQDTLHGASGNDTLYGGAGDDSLDGGAGGDRMVGGDGHDSYLVDDPADRVIESAGAVPGEVDLVFSSISYTMPANVENLNLNVAGAGAIDAVGNSLGNLIGGNPSDNSLSGKGGNDWLDGGPGDDTLVGGTGSDTMNGFLGDDTYEVDSVSDTVNETAGWGTDTVRSTVDLRLAAEVENLVLAGAALAGTGNALANVITGNAGHNTLAGGDGDDRLGGGAGKDSLDGGAGTDTLSGGSGNDILNGGRGHDRLTGGTGSDVFRFGIAVTASSSDRLLDFSSADDRIQFDNAVFAQLGANGALAAAAFRLGAAAADASDRIVYNQATGQLFYDADGSGAGAAVLFATLTGNPALTASDFTVI